MTEFRVDPGELDDLAAELRRRRDRLAESRDELAKATRTLAGKWDGESRDEFVATHAAWSRDQDAQVEALEGAAAIVEKAAVTYREVDRAVGEMFS